MFHLRRWPSGSAQKEHYLAWSFINRDPTNTYKKSMQAAYSTIIMKMHSRLAPVHLASCQSRNRSHAKWIEFRNKIHLRDTYVLQMTFLFPRLSLFWRIIHRGAFKHCNHFVTNQWSTCQCWSFLRWLWICTVKYKKDHKNFVSAWCCTCIEKVWALTSSFDEQIPFSFYNSLCCKWWQWWL